MSKAIICLTETELANAGEFNSDSSEVSYDRRTFTKRASFSLGLKDEAIKYCNNIADTDLKKLIVEEQCSLTIWIQKQVVRTPKSEKINSNKASEIKDTDVIYQNSTSSESSNNLASVKKYRGQVYDPNQPSLSLASSTKKEKSQPLLQRIIHKYRSQTEDTSQIESASKKPRRKYRGQYID